MLRRKTIHHRDKLKGEWLTLVGLKRDRDRICLRVENWTNLFIYRNFFYWVLHTTVSKFFLLGITNFFKQRTVVPKIQAIIHRSFEFSQPIRRRVVFVKKVSKNKISKPKREGFSIINNLSIRMDIIYSMLYHNFARPIKVS